MKRGRAIWTISWRVAVGAVLLLWIFHSIFVLEGRRSIEQSGLSWAQLTRLEQWRVAWTQGPPELWKTLTLVRPGALAASLVFMGMTLVVGVFRWRMVLQFQGLNLSLARTAEISLVAHFFNSFLLGSTGGDLMKAYYAARETHHQKTEAVLTVLVDRLLGLLAMLLFASVMIVINLRLLRAHRPLITLAGVILLMLGGCAVMVAMAFWGGVSKQIPKARDWLRRLPKGELVERGLNASRQFGRKPSFLLRILAVSMVLNVFCVLQIMALADGLQLRVAPPALFVIVPVVVCLSALPISPSGLGVRENLYVLMLGVKEINADPTAALSLSLLAYAGSLLWSLVGGVVYLTRKERDHLAEITDEDSPA